jgi:peptide/nickel transport system substrate-binding protein
MRRSWAALLAGALVVASACSSTVPTASPGSPTPAATPSPTAPTPTPTPTATSPALGRDPGTLVVAVESFGSDFDPASSHLRSEALIWRGIYESLVRLRGDCSCITEAMLADSWEADPTFQRWTFHLHSGITFSDGTALDATAVKVNYVRMIGLHLGAGGILGGFITNPTKQIVVIDPQTIRFDLDRATKRFDAVLAAQYGTGIVSPAVLAAHSTGPADQGHAWLLTHAVGSGPYLLQSIAPGDQVVLVQNPTYWGGTNAPHFQKIVIRQVPDAAARLGLLQSGDVDIADPGTPEDIAAVRVDPRFFVGDAKNFQMNYIILGEYGPLATAAARQAMNYLFPYDTFLDATAKGTMERADGVLPDQMLAHDPDVFAYPTDVAKAGQLLTAAGVARGTVLTFEYAAGFGKQVGLALQAQLAQVGLKLTLIEKTAAAVLADLTTNRAVAKRANMYYWTWLPDYDSPAYFSATLFGSHAAPSYCRCLNGGYYHDARLDQIVASAATVIDDVKLAALFKEAQDILVRLDPAWIPVGQQLEETYFRRDIAGQVFNPLYVQTWDFYALYRQ